MNDDFLCKTVVMLGSCYAVFRPMPNKSIAKSLTLGLCDLVPSLNIRAMFSLFNHPRGDNCMSMQVCL